MMRNLSYSSANEFDKCSWRYYQKYGLGEWIDATNESLQLGNMCHYAIEYYLNDLKDGVENPLTPTKRIGDALRDLYPDFPTDEYLDHLLAVARDYWLLYRRASADYTGADAIRTGQGKVPQDPTRTTQWDQAMRQLDLINRSLVFDEIVWTIEPKVWHGVSFTKAFVEAMVILSRFQLPPHFKRVLHVEYNISREIYELDANGRPVYEDDPDRPNKRRKVIKDYENLALFPGTDVPFKGFIDLVYEDIFGGVRILDWKTSQKCPEAVDVSFMDQPNLYAHFFRELTGIAVTHVEIGHLRSGMVASSEVIWPIVADTITRFVKKVELIKKESYQKQSPTAYGTACLEERKGRKVPCPYLSLCHPEFARAKGYMDLVTADEAED